MDLFQRRKKSREVQQFLLRFANERQSGANKVIDDQRRETRSDTNLSVGVWVVPLVDELPDYDAAFTAVTKNFSWNGVGIICNQPTPADELLIGIPTEPRMTYLRGRVRACTPLGVGYFLLGTQGDEIVSPADYPHLDQIGLAIAGR